MTFTYTWSDADQTSLKREDTDGKVAFIPADPANRDYAEFCNCGVTAAPYVAPPEPAPLTAEEKLNAAGLTIEELKSLLAD